MKEQIKFQIMVSITIARTFLFFLYASIALYASINSSDVFLFLLSIAIPTFLTLYYLKYDKDENDLKQHISFLTSIPFLLAIISGFMEYSTASFSLFLIGCLGFCLSDFLFLKAKEINYKQFLLNIPYTILISLFFILTFYTQELQIGILVSSFIPLFFYNRELIIKKLK